MASGVKTVLDDIDLPGNPEKKCATKNKQGAFPNKHGGKRAYQNKKRKPEKLHSRIETMIYIVMYQNSK
jgi:hypothetical protein